MAYAKTSLRKEKQQLREKMRSMGLDYREIAAEFARRYQLRPRGAWREAYGWSLQDAADRINQYRGHVGLDPGGFAGMTSPHLSEHETWPGHGEKPSGRRPTPYLLAVLSTVYDCTVTDLIDLADRQHMPPADLLILDKYSSQPTAKAPHVNLNRAVGVPRAQALRDELGAFRPAISQPRNPSSGSGAEVRLASEARPQVVLQREVLPDQGRTAAADAIRSGGSPIPSGGPRWANLLSYAVMDPARAARNAAASPLPENRHGSSTLGELQRETQAMTTASLMSDYGRLAMALPGLIGKAELEQVTGNDEITAGIEPVLSDLYAVAAWTLIKADRPDEAWIAAQRSAHAAAMVEDSLRSAAATRCMAEVHMRAGRYGDAARLALFATAHLDAAPRADRDVALCLRGAAMLSAAAAAARRGDSYEAYAALRAARAYATEMGKDMVALGTMFGPVNVIIHNVAIPVELGRPAEAVQSIPAGRVDIPSYLAERKSRFLIDIARGYAGTGDAAAATDALTLAEETAPDETRQHRLTRQLISELLPRSSRSSAIRELADRCAVPY